MSSRYISAIPMVCALLIPQLCLAETIYKWVDDQGKTHYSHQDPGNQNATPVDIAPDDSKNDQGVPDRSLENIKRMALEIEERDKRERAARKKEIDARDKRIALDKENKRRQKEMDDKAIADCRKNHNTYCDDMERVRSEYRKKKGRGAAR